MFGDHTAELAGEQRETLLERIIGGRPNHTGRDRREGPLPRRHSEAGARETRVDSENEHMYERIERVPLTSGHCALTHRESESGDL